MNIATSDVGKFTVFDIGRSERNMEWKFKCVLIINTSVVVSFIQRKSVYIKKLSVTRNQ